MYKSFSIYSRQTKHYTEILVTQKKSVDGEWKYHHKMLRPDWVFDRLTAMIPLGEVYPLTGGRDVWDLIDYIDSFKEPEL